ncbi:hypothetical protein X760_18185 [Mesorhizobium sp. LSHC422A00]|uniref:hypothetical protein n=1 Tax=Mesorhizobium sp. LSHC422A00 TaxID=1287294 RepID=UPI0003CE285E|nr:hypothetical protein [Mesorhizobium sp. LSHC422A00]ESX60157.1 hypothetical protein X760_18185 [Mesorhizobium sp. LSHC422A00]
MPQATLASDAQTKAGRDELIHSELLATATDSSISFTTSVLRSTMLSFNTKFDVPTVRQ